MEGFFCSKNVPIKRARNRGLVGKSVHPAELDSSCIPCEILSLLTRHNVLISYLANVFTSCHVPEGSLNFIVSEGAVCEGTDCSALDSSEEKVLQHLFRGKTDNTKYNTAAKKKEEIMFSALICCLKSIRYK